MPGVDKRHRLEGDVFTFTSIKNGKVFIFWSGKQVKTLSGVDAGRFLDKISGLGLQDAQLLMAKITGNFKHGNER
jgi:hypothetical protein